MKLPDHIQKLPKAAQDRWVALYEALKGEEALRVRTANALIETYKSVVTTEDWDDLAPLPSPSSVSSDTAAESFVQSYQSPPTRIAAQLPKEAQDIWVSTHNMCALLGCDRWECEDAAWRAVDEAGYAPEDLTKYVKVVKEDHQFSGDISLLFHEATGDASTPAGSLWDVVLISAGLSKNKRRYSEATLKEAATLFNGVKSYADHDLSGKSSINRSVRDVVGWFDNVRFDEGAKSIIARFHIFESAIWLRNMLLDMSRSGVSNLIGLSINAEGEQRVLKEGEALVNDVTKITRVYSVDVVTEPAAGGSLVRLVASTSTPNKEAPMNREALKRLLESGGSADDLKLLFPDNVADIDAILAEGITVKVVTQTTPEATPVTPALDPATIAEAVKLALNEQVAPLNETMKQLQVTSVRNYAAAKLAESKLPITIKTKLNENFTSLLERRVATESEFDSMLQESMDLWAAFEQHAGSGAVRGLPPRGNAATASGRDEFILALDGALHNVDQKDADGNSVKRFNSFKEAYFKFTGHDPYSTTPFQIIAESTVAYDSAIHAKRIQESLETADWAQIFSDRMYRRMLAEYRLPGLDDWRKLVSNIENVPDFRSQRRERLGGYGLLETVGERETYPQMTSPGDEEVSYAVTKRGGLDDITFEMVVNDDLRNIRNIPVKLARAARQTLYRFVLDFLKDGFTATVFDGLALFHATHTNLATAALSDSALQTQWQSMRSQQPYGNETEFLGTRPKYLWVPNELEVHAWKLANSMVTILGANYNATEPNFFKSQFEVVVVDYWTDANNWFMTADPAEIPTVEMGFLNGQEEPELFVQDQPNVGSVMTADKITYKIRHIYSGTVLDFRGFTGNNVT